MTDQHTAALTKLCRFCGLILTKDHQLRNKQLNKGHVTRFPPLILIRAGRHYEYKKIKTIIAHAQSEFHPANGRGKKEEMELASLLPGMTEKKNERPTSIAHSMNTRIYKFESSSHDAHP